MPEHSHQIFGEDNTFGDTSTREDGGSEAAGISVDRPVASGQAWSPGLEQLEGRSSMSLSWKLLPRQEWAWVLS